MQFLFVLWSDNHWVKWLVACGTGTLNGIQLCFEDESSCIMVCPITLGWSLNSLGNSNSALDKLDKAGFIQIPSFKVTFSFFYDDQKEKWLWNDNFNTGCLSLHISMWRQVRGVLTELIDTTTGFPFPLPIWLALEVAVSHHCSDPKLLLITFCSHNNKLTSDRYDVDIGPRTLKGLMPMPFWRVSSIRKKNTELWK